MLKIAQSDTFIINASAPKELPKGGQEINVNLSLEKIKSEGKRIVRGLIRDDCGNPLENATVKVFTLDYKPVDHTFSDIKGEYRFDQLAKGSYRITAKKEPGYILSESKSFALAKEGTVNLDISLDPIPDTAIISSIYGKIYDIEGKAIPNAQVNIFQKNDSNSETLFAETETNQSGQFFTVNLPAGEYIVKANKRGYKLSQGTIVVIDNNEFAEVNISLIINKSENMGTVSGIISDKHNNPIHGAFVALYKLNGEKEKLINLARSNIEGLYLFTEVEPGEYLVKAKGIKLS
ncbi:MSCRAMM family protein [Natronospora cellulosivora (SeqCode)]